RQNSASSGFRGAYAQGPPQRPRADRSRPEELDADVIHRPGTFNRLAPDDLHMIDEFLPVNRQMKRSHGSDPDPRVRFQETAPRAAIEDPDANVLCDDGQGLCRREDGLGTVHDVSSHDVSTDGPASSNGPAGWFDVL